MDTQEPEKQKPKNPEPENQEAEGQEDQEPKSESAQEPEKQDAEKQSGNEAESPEMKEEEGQAEKSTEPVCEKTVPKKAFVVLCEREKMNTEVLNALKKFGIEPIILYPDNPEHTIEQKLMAHPHVSFSCVALAGDDFIYDRLEGKPADAVLGAKQSAIFHCAYLSGKFGRMNTFILYKAQDAFHLPTTIHNAIFTPYEPQGRWPEILESRLKEVEIL